MLLLLIQEISNDEECDAITQIFNLYYPRMKNVAYDVLRNPQDAEDAAMNAIKYMCRHPGMFVEYKSPQTISLIMLCTKTSAIDMFRTNRRRSQFIFSLDGVDEETRNIIEEIPDPDIPSEIIISQENREMLSEAIDSLDEIYRTPILLRYNHQMKNTEIAELLNIDVNKVNNRIFRAKKILGQKIKDLGYNT